MKLKGLMIMLAAAGALAACSSSDDIAAGDNSNGSNNGSTPGETVASDFTGTQVYIGVESLGLQNASILSTRAEGNYDNAFLSPKATATYKIQVDPRMGYNTPKGTYVTVKADGQVFTDTPKHAAGTIRNAYVMSTDGSGVNNFLVDAITVQNAEEALKAAGYKVNINNQTPSFGTFKGKDGNIYDVEPRIIWYLAAEKNGAWTVEGILTDKDDIQSVSEACKDELSANGSEFKLTFVEGQNLDFNAFDASYEDNNIKAIDKTLRYDIAQQLHKDWGEVKTSIHLQEAKDVTITLPIKRCYTIDANSNGKIDTAQVVKIFGKSFNYTSVNGTSNSDINVEVERNADAVVIKISGITEELLKSAERKYNDGITFEIHTFYKLTSDKYCPEEKGTNLIEPIWGKLKTATITYDGAKTGRIYSAYYKGETIEETPTHKKNPHKNM